MTHPFPPRQVAARIESGPVRSVRALCNYALSSAHDRRSGLPLQESDTGCGLSSSGMAELALLQELHSYSTVATGHSTLLVPLAVVMGKGGGAFFSYRTRGLVGSHGSEGGLLCLALRCPHSLPPLLPPFLPPRLGSMSEIGETRDLLQSFRFHCLFLNWEQRA